MRSRSLKYGTMRCIELTDDKLPKNQYYHKCFSHALTGNYYLPKKSAIRANIVYGADFMPSKA